MGVVQCPFISEGNDICNLWQAAGLTADTLNSASNQVTEKLSWERLQDNLPHDTDTPRLSLLVVQVYSSPGEDADTFS